MENQVRKQIFELIDPDYQKVSASLNPGINNILGVRLPKLRKIERKLQKMTESRRLDQDTKKLFER